MISLRMGFSSFNQQGKHGMIVDEIREAEDHVHGHAGLDSISSSSEVSSDSDSADEATSSDSASPPPPSSSSSDSGSSGQLAAGTLLDMSSLMQQLPFKRGLSKYFQGKSQSFTSLSNVRSLEDLAKPENPYNKRLKSSRSYGGGLSDQTHRSSNLSRANSSSRFISKRTSSRVSSCSSLISAKRNGSSLLGNRPPVPHPPHRSSTSTNGFSNQTPLFAA